MAHRPASRGRRPRAASSLLLAAAAVLLLLSAVQQPAAAMPMHPDVLDFVRLPSLELGDSSSGSSSSSSSGVGGARRLQQDGPLFRDNGGPFTFDGFGFGYGGLFPGGGFFDGFALNIYNVLFRDILNEGLNQYLASALPNSPLNPIEFLPPAIGNLFNRDIVALFGYDAVDKFVGQWLKRAKAEQGDLVPAGCVGPTYKLKISGGECEMNEDGSVDCSQPTIKFDSTPYTCNAPYREAASLEGQSYRYKVQFGRERKGEIGLPVGVYNFGAALNVTVPYLGFTLATRRVANDFGVQQWYQFVGNVILNQLLRVQAALLSGAVDSRIATQDAQDAANAALGGRRLAQTAAGGSSTTSSGSSGWSAAIWRLLLGRIAQTLGIDTSDLVEGLSAVNLLPASVANSMRALPAAAKMVTAAAGPAQQLPAKKQAAPQAKAAAAAPSAGGPMTTQQPEDPAASIAKAAQAASSVQVAPANIASDVGAGGVVQRSSSDVVEGDADLLGAGGAVKAAASSASQQP